MCCASRNQASCIIRQIFPELRLAPDHAVKPTAFIFSSTRGGPVEWTAELFSDIPWQQLGWRTIADSPLEQSGVVKFLPAYGHTSRRLNIDIIYKIPSGQNIDLLSLLLAKQPLRKWEGDLHRLKMLIETGEIATTMGQSSGRRSPLLRRLHREGKS